MKRRISVLLIACALIVGMLASGAQAASSASTVQGLLSKLRVALQQADGLESTSGVINSANVLVDDLEAAMQKNDKGAMTAAVLKFTGGFTYFDDYNNNNNDYDEDYANCRSSVFITFVSKLPALYKAIDEAPNTDECLFINITNALSDIIGSVYAAEICKYESLPYDPNMTPAEIQNNIDTQNWLLKNTQTFQFYSLFATMASDHYCIDKVTWVEYFTLFMKFLSAFKYAFYAPVTFVN
jgi:hypothetical protein